MRRSPTNVEGFAESVDAELVTNSLVSLHCIKLVVLIVCNVERTSSMQSLEERKRFTKY